MDARRLAEADRIVSTLSLGKREAVREIIVEATHRGALSVSARRYLDTATGSAFVAEVLAEALGSARPEVESLLS